MNYCFKVTDFDRNMHKNALFLFKSLRQLGAPLRPPPNTNLLVEKSWLATDLG